MKLLLLSLLVACAPLPPKTRVITLDGKKYRVKEGSIVVVTKTVRPPAVESIVPQPSQFEDIWNDQDLDEDYVTASSLHDDEPIINSEPQDMGEEWNAVEN